MQMISTPAAAARNHLVLHLHVSGNRPDIICALYTCSLIPAHVRDAHSWAGVHLMHNFQFQFRRRHCDDYCEVVIITRSWLTDKKNKNGDTALLVAASNGHDDVVVRLLERGAKHDMKNKQGDTALSAAAAAAIAGHFVDVREFVRSKEAV